MLGEIILNFEWQTVIFWIICGISALCLLMIIPQDIWVFLGPFVVVGLFVIGLVTYIIWYLTSFVAGWYDWSYWAVFGIGIGITILYFIIAGLVVSHKEKKDESKTPMK